MFCPACGKSIEDDARFCRFCGAAQGSTASAAGASTSSTPLPAAGTALEDRLRQLFPRHHLQDGFMHVATIAAFMMAVIGFIVGFFLAVNWVGTNFLLGSIALSLFLILRESTLSHIRVRGGPPAGANPRYHAGRRGVPPTDAPVEAATAESSPPTTSRPPAGSTPRPPAPPK